MARAKTHKDVEFMVKTTRWDAEYFKTTDEAVAYALANNVWRIASDAAETAIRPE